MKKIIAFLSIIAFAIGLTACGGGSSGGGGAPAPAPVPSGTAAQYFTKTAVGNYWTSGESGTYTSPGQPTSTWTALDTVAITAFTGGVVTFTDTWTVNGTSSQYTGTYQLDSSGALVSYDSSGGNKFVELPPTFKVGTTWVMSPATTTLGAVNATIEAFNVTRRVPAGTFTDCLQINITRSYTANGYTYTEKDTNYISATTGSSIEESGTFSGTGGWSSTYDYQLQRYVAK